MDKVNPVWRAMHLALPLSSSGLGGAGWGWLLGAVLLTATVLLVLRQVLRARPKLPKTRPEAATPPGKSQQPVTGEFAAEVPGLATHLVASLRVKEERGAATDHLLKLGEAGLPALKEHFWQTTDEPQLQRLAQVCGQLGTPAARQLLLEVAQSANLPGRAAALRALAGFASVPADAPTFRRMVEEEMRLAQQLLHGVAGASAPLQAALRYEVRKILPRLLGLLLQLYERPPVLAVQRETAHLASERPAGHWQELKSLLPRPLYRGLQALLGQGTVPDQLPVFDDLLGPLVLTETVPTAIVRRGTQAFSTWTISVALGQWQPQPATVAYLYPYLRATNSLIREAAWEVLQRVPLQRPAAYDQLLVEHPDVAALLSAAPAALAGGVSARARVLLLKATPLFSETPENVLGDMVPIMREVAFQPGQEIFAKGTPGTSLFIVCEGEIDIFNGTELLTCLREGDFFGELALLDTEPRSATAVAHSPALTVQLEQDEFYTLLETRPEVLHNLMRALCQRLRQQNEKARVVAPQL